MLRHVSLILALGVLGYLVPATAYGGAKPHCRDLTFGGAAGAASNDKVTLRVVDVSGSAVDESCQLQVQNNETARAFAARLTGAWGSGTGAGCVEPNPLPTKSCGTGIGGESCQHKYKFKPDNNTVDPDDGLIRIRICCRESAGCAGLKLAATPISVQTKVDPALVFEPPVPPTAGITITPVALDPIGVTQRPHAELLLCRKDLGQEVDPAYGALLKRVAECLDDQANGSVPPGGCQPPPIDPRVADAVAKARAALDATATGSCQPTGSPPAEFGYGNCPVPCNAIPVTAWADAADCIACQAEAAVFAGAAAAYGPSGPPAGLSPEAQSCQQGIGRTLVGLAGVVLDETRKCQERGDKGKAAVPAGQNCKSADPKGRKALAASNVPDAIQTSCPTSLSFIGLQTCGIDLPGVSGCVTTEGFKVADRIADAVWPELRAGSPSGAFLDL